MTAQAVKVAELLEKLIDEAANEGAGIGGCSATFKEEILMLFGKGAFTVKDIEHLEELAVGFEKVVVRPRMPGPGFTEKARRETEMFQVRAARCRSIAARIKRVTEG